MILKPLQNDFSCEIIAIYVDLKITSRVNLFKIGSEVKTLELATVEMYISFLSSTYLFRRQKIGYFNQKLRMESFTVTICFHYKFTCMRGPQCPQKGVPKQNINQSFLLFIISIFTIRYLSI